MEVVHSDFSRPNSTTIQENSSLGVNGIFIEENEDPQPQTSIMDVSTNELPAIPTAIEVDVQDFDFSSFVVIIFWIIICNDNSYYIVSDIFDQWFYRSVIDNNYYYSYFFVFILF